MATTNPDYVFNVSGTTTIIPATGNASWQGTGWKMVAQGAAIVQWQDTNGVLLSGQIDLTAAGSKDDAQYHPDGWFTTLPGVGVQLVFISGNGVVSGTLVAAKRGQ